MQIKYVVLDTEKELEIAGGVYHGLSYPISILISVRMLMHIIKTLKHSYSFKIKRSISQEGAKTWKKGGGVKVPTTRKKSDIWQDQNLC